MSSTPIKYIIPLLFIPAILVIIWFRGGLITGGGEEGILFYNTSKTFKLSNSIWIDYMTGITNVNWLQRSPIIYLSTLFEKFGIPLFIFQMILFYSLILVGTTSVYYLTKNLLGGYKQSNTVSLVAAIYYLLNPFSFSQVWGRSLYTQYFAFSLLPLSLLFFYFGMKRKKYIYGFLIAITSSTLAWAYGFLTYIIVYWFLLLLYFLFVLIISKKRRSESFFGIKFFFLTFVLWCFFNCWWFVPLAASFTNVYTAGITGSEDNLGTLMGVSKSYPLDVISRLLHKGYFFDSSAYSTIYSTFPFQLISIIPVLFLLFGLILVIRKKEIVNLKFFAGLLILGLIVSLGANFPFEKLFVFFFKHITLLQAFRNPFEKFGIVYALGYSVVFAYGLISFFEKQKFKNLALLLVLFLICGVYAWPIWTGRVIASPDKKIGLDIPTYYKDLQNWLENQGDDYRLLLTPIWAGDGSFYRWGGGRYQGVDPMVFMLDQPPISNSSRAPFFGDFLTSIRKNMEREDVVPAISLLRAKFLIDRKDAVMLTQKEKDQFKFLTSTIYPPQGTESNIKTICQNMMTNSRTSGVAWIVCPTGEKESDLSDIKYLHVKLKTNVAAFVEVAISDLNGKRIRWDGRVDPDYRSDTNDWQNITIPLSTPTENNGEIDLSKIHLLEVLAHPKDNALASVWEIDLSEIKLDPGTERKTNEYNRVAEFGNLTIFEPVKFNPPPEFGSLLGVEKINGFPEFFEQINKKRDQINVTGFLLSSQNPGKDISKLENKSSIQAAEKQKITDTRYWMKVGKGESGFIILSIRFDPQWKILSGVSQEELKGGLISDFKLLKRSAQSEDSHFVVNGYANLWKIDGENNQYAVVFMPQVLADISLKISIFSVLFVIGFLMLWKAKKYTSLH